MKDKVSIVREYILDKIENLEYPINSQLPVVRELCKETDASFAIVQRAVASLEHDGIVVCEARRGAFVRKNCFERIINNHLVIFKNNLPWLTDFNNILKKKFSAIRLCSKFNNGMFEIRTTQYLQQHRDEYMDLAPFFNKIVAEREEFFQRPFVGFDNPDGSLFGIPFVFSPRLIIYNKSMLEKANLPIPSLNWSMDDFIFYIQELKKFFPADKVLNYSDCSFFWMNFIFRNGGEFFDAKGFPCFDSEKVAVALETVRSIRKTLELGDDFINFDSKTPENCALLLDGREVANSLKYSNFDDYGTITLPNFPHGTSLMSQATNLLCVRKECADNAMVTKFVKFMLSEEIQNYIGQERYGIPIRKSSALNSINSEDPRDLLFLSEMNNMSTAFNLTSVELGEAAQLGIFRIIKSDEPILPKLQELANAIRIIIKAKL